MNERGMKQPERRPGGPGGRENPTSRTRAESKPTPKGCPLKQQSDCLKQKVSGGQSIAASGRQRDHQLMNHAGKEEDGPYCGVRADHAAQRPEGEGVREFVKRGVPPLTPEL